MLRGNCLVELREMTSGSITLQVLEPVHTAQVSDFAVGAQLLVAALASISVNDYIQVLAKVFVDGRAAAEDPANVSLQKVSTDDLMLLASFVRQ